MNKKAAQKKRGFMRFSVDMLCDPKWSKLWIPLITVLLTILTTIILLLILGKNPITALAGFLKASGFIAKDSYTAGKGALTDLLSYLDILAPMMFAALGVIVAFKTGLFNIGTSGQMLAAGFAATLIVGYSGMDAWLAKPLVLLVGIVVGGAIAAFIGFLKYKFNIHEVVTSIMLNYIISYTTGYFINTHYVNVYSRSSEAVSEASRLTLTNLQWGSLKVSFSLSIFLAIGAVFLVKFLLDRTVLGFELKATGSNRHAAQYSGINVGRSIVLAMTLSGMLAGLAGVSYYLGYYNTMIPKTLAAMGYDAIAVSLLGGSSPLGAIFASALVTLFQNGGNYVSSVAKITKEIASLITGMLLLFSAMNPYIRYLARRKRDKYIEAERLLLKEQGVAESEVDD